MPGEQYTDADALGLFLTGAASDGGDQPDPDLSLGNYRSSSREEQIGFFLNRSIPGIIVERVAGANENGLGLLETVSGNSLRWTAPSDTPGTAVAIADSETKMLQSGGDPAKYIVVSRNIADDLVGSSTINLVPVFNNTVGSSNVPSGESLVKLRCLAMKNNNASSTVSQLKIWIKTLATQQTSDAGQLGGSGAGTIETTGSFTDWPSIGFCRITTAGDSLREIVYYSARTDTVLTIPAAGRELLGTTAAAGASDDKLDCVPGVKIAKEAPSGGHFTIIEDEYDTEPVSGFSWTTGINKESGLFVINRLAPGEIIGIWLWLAVVEGRTATPILENIVEWQFRNIKPAIEVSAEAGINLSPAAVADKSGIITAQAEAGVTISPTCIAAIIQPVITAAQTGITLSAIAQANIGELKDGICETGIEFLPTDEEMPILGLNEAEGLYRIADDALERYELFRGVDEEPDLDGEPYETFTELPHTTDGEVSTELFFVLRRRNKFNLNSLNIKSWSVKTDADGQIVLPNPDAPQNISIVPAAGAKGYVEAEYLFDDDNEYAATHWLIYFTDDGTDPDPEVDEPTIVTMNKANGMAALQWTSPAADNEDTLKVLVRTRLVSGEDTFDSVNTDIYSCTASDQGPAVPDGRAFLGYAAESM